MKSRPTSRTLIAAMARSFDEKRDILVATTGGHGEIFVQPFAASGEPIETHSSLGPEAAAAMYDIDLVAGTKASKLVEERGFGEAHDILPDARYANALPQALLTDRLAPIYGRAPDAKLPQGKLRT